MACAAINGYHSVVSYCWLMNGYTCRGEETPLLYTTREGEYKCIVKNDDLNIHIFSIFLVQSKLIQTFVIGLNLLGTCHHFSVLSVWEPIGRYYVTPLCLAWLRVKPIFHTP